MIIQEKLSSNDGSVKYLWELSDGKTVESIYFAFREKLYVCISSQVGCNVKCPFCETGKQNVLRNLEAHEIYDQVALAVDDLKSSGSAYSLDQVAVAGMGESLLNFKNLKEASANLINDGLTRTVSISTSGIVPKIRELVDTQVSKLFISLHATTNETRNILVPMNKKYPIPELLDAACYFYNQVGTPVTATYLLFGGLNDSDDDLNRLTELLDPQAFIIQLSEWNFIDDVKFARSPRLDYFQEQLASRGFEVFITRSKGADIQGGCGQLRSRNLAKNQQELKMFEGDGFKQLLRARPELQNA